MSLLRNDVQVALQWLHGWALETLAHFRFVVEHDVGQESATLCNQLAAEREQLSRKLADAIRETDDLPSEPDPDREAVVQLQEQLASVFAEQGGDAMLDHCRAREQGWLEQVTQEAGVLVESQYASLLADCKSSAERAIKRLGA